MHKFYNMALRLARASTHKQHRMAAVVVRGGAIVSWAANSSTWKRHAEIRCLKHGVTGDKIIIARAGDRMSKPCSLCMEAIRASGIRQIVYKDWQGILREERI